MFNLKQHLNKHSSTNIVEQQPLSPNDVIFYHGTNGSVIDDMLSNGLYPSNIVGSAFDSSYRVGKNRKNAIFITNNFQWANDYGTEVMCRKEDDSFGVLTIEIPANELYKLTEDPLSPKGCYMFPNYTPQWITDWEIFDKEEGD